jgi:CubicO group peptidase (beta-lactamase class C family)
MSATYSGFFALIYAASLAMVVSFANAQDSSFQPPPTTLSEALMRLQALDSTPVRQKQPRPIEFFGEFPKHELLSLESCQKAAEYSAKMDGRALVFIVGSAPGYERYEPGWSRWKSQRIGNSSQCFAGVVAALAVQDEMFRFDDPVCATITEWASDEKKSKVTIRQLLTLTSGIESGDANYASTYKLAIQAKLENDPGKVFAYGSNAFQVFGELICRKLAEKTGAYDPMGYATYLDQKVFKPLKIEPGSWLQTTDREANVAQGAFLSAVDFAKYGVLLSNEGAWEGKELIKKDLVQEILKGSEANPKYAMGFWLVSPEEGTEVSPEARMIMPSFGRTAVEGMYIAAGEGKQRLYVLPKEKVVIVRLGNPRINLFRDETFFRNALVKDSSP